MISRLAMDSIDAPLFPKQERVPGMTTPALRSARRALPILALAAALLGATAASAPAASTLLHSYDGEGTFLDGTGTYNGTNSGATFTGSGLGHNSDRAFALNGANQYFSLGSGQDFYPTGSFTIDAWVQTTIATGPVQTVASMDECSGASLQNCASPGAIPVPNARSTWQLGVKDGVAWAFIRDGDGGGSPTDSYGQTLQNKNAPTVADGAWHHLTFVRDSEAGRLSLYQDGKVYDERVLGDGASGPLENRDNEADPTTIGARLVGWNSTTCTIGCNNNPNFEFAGAIDDVRFYQGAEYPDKTPPVITGQILGDATGDWYTSDLVTVRWTVKDESVVRSTTGCTDTEITEDTAGTTFTCSASSAGGDSTATLFVKRDATPPVLTCNQPSTIHFAVGSKGDMTATATDALTGVKAVSVSKPIDSAEKGAHSVTLSTEDNVGNFGSVNCPYLIIKPVIRKAAFSTLLKAPAATACVSKHRLSLRLKKLTGAAITAATFTASGKTMATVSGLKLQQPIKLTKLPAKGKYSVAISLTDVNGDKRVASRTYHACAAKHKRRK